MLIQLLSLIVTQPGLQPAASQPTTRPAPPTATQPAIPRELREKVGRLINDLGHREFATRERSQQELRRLGESVWPLLIGAIPHSNEEINDRLADIVGKPARPELRVDLALRLMSGGDPDRIKSAVYMLFEEPVEVCDLFENRTRDATGVLKRIAPHVHEQLLSRKRMHATLQEHLPRLRRKNPEKAEELIKMDKETNWYAATAAYEMAIDALAEEGTPPPVRGAGKTHTGD